MVRAHVLISGKVQGVWFRASTKQVAESLGLSGWVRNLSDGRVEAVLKATLKASARPLSGAGRDLKGQSLPT